MHTSARLRLTLAAGAIVAGTAFAGDASATTAPPDTASSSPPSVTLTQVAGIEEPVDLTYRTGETQLYIVSKEGTITRMDGEASTVVLDLSDQISRGNEQGLLGLAFHPDGTRAYVNFTDNDGNTNVVEYAVGEDGSFDAGSARSVLVIEQPYENHNGGGLAFGPDGMLYIGMGDGGDGGDPERRASNPSELLGKLLRIDPTTPSGDLQYTIPADNPFVGSEGTRGEIWASGLRNPWRFSFDPETGDLWIADVGQTEIEEIDFAPATDGLNAGRGLNFGWSGFEGSQPYNDDITVESHTPPIAEYSHDSGGCSVSGGVRARGEGAGPLAGWYLYGDFCTGQLFGFSVSGEGPEVTAGEQVELASLGESISAVVSGPDGTVYVLTLDGNVHRVDAAA